MEKNKDKINSFIIIITTILLFLDLTRLHELMFFRYLFILNLAFSYCIMMFLNYKQIIRKKYFKNNFLIILILFFYIITIIYHHFNVNSIKDFAYLSYFLIIVNTLLKKDNELIINFSRYIVYTCLTVNVISILISIFEYFGISFLSFRVLDIANGNFNFYGLYTNPNALGLGTFISLMLFISFLKSKNNIINIICMLFFLACILLAGSRTSLISSIVYLLVYFMISKKNISRELIAKFSIITIFVFFTCLTTISIVCNNSNSKQIINFENKLNSFTTERYIMWKYSLLSMDKPSKIFFGEKSSNIGKERVKQISKEEYLKYNNFPEKLAISNNNHNGYIQLFVSSGIICTILIFIWLYYGIIHTDYKLIPIVLAILCLNIFESEFTNSHTLAFFILCYFLFYNQQNKLYGLIKNIFDKICDLKNKIVLTNYKELIEKLKTTGFFSIFLSSVFGKVVVFLANIILARILSKSDYGLYAYVFNCFAVLTLMGDFGTSSAAMQYITENLGNEKEQFKYLKFSILIGSIFSILSGILILVSPLFYPYTIDESAGIVKLFFLIPFFSTLANTFAIILRAHQKNKKFAFYNFFTVFVNYALIIPLTYFIGIKGIVYATYGYYIFSFFLAIYLSREYLKKFFAKYVIKTKEKINFIKFSFIMQLNITLSHLLLIIDTFVIGLIISDANIIATYKVANSIPQALAFIPTCVVIYILPYFIKHNKEKEWLSLNIKKIIIYGCVIYGIFALGLIAFSKIIIQILYGMQYRDAVLAFNILIVGFYFNAVFTVPCSSIMQGLRKVNVNLVISIISLILNFALNFVFINIFGFVGVAITTTLIQVLTSAYYVYYLKKKVIMN